jgi:molybdopterin synthase catalytic subunit
VALEYEAHVPMAEAKLKEIGEAVYGRWPGVRHVVIMHRIGRLLVGEASVAIGVSAAHRQDAFEGCQYAIDTVKRIVPIWKRELFEDGSAWVGLQGESPPPGWNAGDVR